MSGVFTSFRENPQRPTATRRWMSSQAMALRSDTNPEEQLRTLFSSCKLTSSGALTSIGLQQLCEKLHLGDSATQLLSQLTAQRHELGGPSKHYDDRLEDVTFDEFREALVYLLSQQEHLSCASFIAHGEKMSAAKEPSCNEGESAMDTSTEVTVPKEQEEEEATSKVTSPALCVSQVGKPLEELEQQLNSSVNPEQDSQPPSLLYSGDNEEEYLRATWQRLGVGHDGYLSLEELATVCHAIGMEKVANEVLEQLFSRLDVDGDGRISFEEFVHMFQNGGPSGNTSLVLDESLHQETPGTPLSRMSSVGEDRRGVSRSESGVFSTIDPENTGYATVESILEMWDSFNISNGADLLGNMGFPHRPHERVSLSELSAAMEEDVQLPEEQSPSTRITSMQMTVLTYLQEIKFLRFSLETARGERNKLRCDLNEANQRVALLAQELDDHNAHMEASSQHQIQELERQYRDQVRDLQDAVTRERDAARDQVSAVTREMQLYNDQLQQEENKLKSKIASLQSDAKRLEAENLEMSEKVQEAEKQMSQMEKLVSEMQELRSKVAEYESMSPRDEEYRRLLDRLERVTSENQQLRDSNDELLSQLDAFPLRQNNGRNNDKESSLDGSCLGDYVDQPMGLLAPVKRRGSNSGSGDDSCEEESPRGGKVRRFSKGLNIHYVDVGSYDESFFDTSMSNLLKSPPASHGAAPDSQPASLDELNIKVPRKNTAQNDVLDTSIQEASVTSVRSMTQLVNKELKQELEVELAQLRDERDRLAKQLELQREEFAHQLEKKEFEYEAALNECTSVRKQLEKTTSQLNLSLPEAPQPVYPQASTPIKSSSSAPTSLRDKCTRCGDTQGQLTMALEELEMALRREEQERSQRINAETLLSNRQENGSTTESGATESSTAYPNSPSEPSSASKLLMQGNEGEGRVRVLEEQCRGLEGELARVRVEVLKMVEERDQLVKQKDLLEQRKDNVDFQNMKSRCQVLVDKIRRKRMANAPNVKENTEEQREKETNTEKEGDQGTKDTKEDNAPDLLKSSTSHDEVDKALPVKNSEDMFEELDKEVGAFEEELCHERDGLEKQKAALLEKNNKLEQNLEILRVEFDKSEDYWTLKLQEEQDYYEEERRLYDEKFSSLEKKIREYEELVLSGGGGGRDNSDESDRLSTIDESAVWEKQVTELEEEVSLLKKQVDDLREERQRMECVWEARVQEERQLANQKCNNLQDQICNLTTQLHQAQHQVNSVLEELDKVRRESEQRIKDLSNQHRLRSQGNPPLVNGHGVDSEGRLSPATPDDDRQFFQGAGSVGEETINGSLRAQLRQCQSRLRYLEAALRQHHTHAHHILTVTREQHAAEVQNLEGMMAATQQMLGQHIAKYKDQLSKASRSDSLVRELYLENAQLMRALQITESRQKSAEEASRRLQVAALGPHTVS
ncbi:blastoderm-specific protein 25D-like isoform X6 [Penaeus japonicus]|uniref:blastoderm-specific protein 25D-like isoform X6 n=1 Tax=Penaeus japonicus TaxID=27405 RepID=UPI001C70C6DC|nr:blastoderm-specific protein 25D-like isoform X6 [Penaeus japonicus]